MGTQMIEMREVASSSATMGSVRPVSKDSPARSSPPSTLTVECEAGAGEVDAPCCQAEHDDRNNPEEGVEDKAAPCVGVVRVVSERHCC